MDEDLEEELDLDGELRALKARDHLQLSRWCLLEGEKDPVGEALEHAERARTLIESLGEEDAAAARELVEGAAEQLNSAD